MSALNKKIASAKHATASLGKFDKTLKLEDKIANKGKKRKFDSNIGNKEVESSRVKKIATAVAGNN